MVTVLEQIYFLLTQQTGALISENLSAFFLRVAQLYSFTPKDVVQILEKMTLRHLQLFFLHGHAISLDLRLHLNLLALCFSHLFLLSYIDLQVKKMDGQFHSLLFC